MPAPQTEITICGADGAVLLQKAVLPGDYVLGRAPECELAIEADLVSRRHAQLTIHDDHALIEDLGSSNGTFVNGKAVTEPTRLWPNQKIQVGTATVELHRVKSVPPPGVSLAPGQAAVQRLLPEESLRDKKYAIGGVIAQGGMGAILDAKDSATERTVAMKVMLDGSSPDDLTRFVAEAKVTAQLEHPNIVPVHELSVDENGQPFYTMKMVRGITLKKVLELLAEGTEATVKKYPLSALLTIYQKLCDAVAFAHSKGVIHRDLKPENVMLGDFGEVLVMDWGLAKRMKDEGGRMKQSAPSAVGDENSNARSAQNSSSFIPHPSSFSAAPSTLAGTIMGTPQYMSPEQARGEVADLDIRSDLYALGAILYHILALRPPVTGRTAMEIVSKVAKGYVEPLVTSGREAAPGVPQSAEAKNRGTRRGGGGESGRQVGGRAGAASLPHLPGGSIPDSLAAVVRKSMAFERDQRYWTVEELQSDLTAYQSGFATRAEKAGLGRQFRLALKRHKVAAIGAAAVLIVGTTLGTKAILEGKRAERGEAQATQALSDLKKSAPALLKVAESEADTQHFTDSLRDLDAALALDPALTRARWQRAWAFLGLEKWSEAAAALRLAQQRDPPNAKLASILPAVEKLADAPDTERWKSEAAREVFGHLQAVGAAGPALAFVPKLKLVLDERFKLVVQRLTAALGKGGFNLLVKDKVQIEVSITDKPVRSLEPFRGLPIDSLQAPGTSITDLEPLRGMRLHSLNINKTDVSDLSPLAGMPLSTLHINTTKVSDLTPLHGMPLIELDVTGTGVSQWDALRGMPLVRLNASGLNVSDGTPLHGAPLESLQIAQTKIVDLSFLRGMPLHSLRLSNVPFRNLAPLRGLPLESLDLYTTGVSDLSPLEGAPLKQLNIVNCNHLRDLSPILTLPKLEVLECQELTNELLPLRDSKTLQNINADAFHGEGHKGIRTTAEFWRAYDERKAAGK